MGTALLLRYRLGHRDADADEGTRVLHQALRARRTLPAVHLTAYEILAVFHLEQRQWSQAADSLAQAVRLSAESSLLAGERPDSLGWLLGNLSRSSIAAACAIRADDPARAAVLVEQGRAVLLSHVVARRSLRQEFDSQDPVLTELERIEEERRLPPGSHWIERRPPRSQTHGRSWNPFSSQDVTGRRGELLRQRDTALTALGDWPKLDGLDAGVLLKEATHGPLVLFSLTSDLGSHALTVTPVGVQAIELPRATPDEVIRQHERLHHAARGLRRAVRGADRETILLTQRAFTDILGWTWDSLVEPVLDALDLAGVLVADDEQAPRIWWMPTGTLWFLPLHAAGRPGVPGALDRVVSSYAPSARLLGWARSRGGEPKGRAALFVGPGGARKGPELPFVALDTRAVRRAFPEVTGMPSPITRDAVLEAMPGNRYVHLAGHSLDPREDEAGALFLSEGEVLTPGDVAALRLPEAELAFLASCATAQPNPPLTDEAMHMSAAFSMAGFRHVVGSQWPVDDEATGYFSELFYERLSTGRAVSRALHGAQHEMRRRYPSMPSLWATYLHVGP